MKNDNNRDVPLSESSISLKLALIQRRCKRLMDDGELELRLEDAVPGNDEGNPYNRG